MYFSEDRVEKVEDEKVLVIKEFLRSILYCAVINFINHSLMLPTIFSILPLMLLIFLFMMFTRYWKNKKRQYAFLIPYVVEYFGFCLYFYNRGNLMILTAICMTAILAVWGVLCIECFVKNAKRNLIGFLILALVAGGAYFTIWKYYDNRAMNAVHEITANGVLPEEKATEVDALGKELNVVFYSKKRVKFLLAEVVKETQGDTSSEEFKLYQDFTENLKKADGKWISTLVMEEIDLSQNLENLRLKDK